MYVIFGVGLNKSTGIDVMLLNRSDLSKTIGKGNDQILLLVCYSALSLYVALKSVAGRYVTADESRELWERDTLAS